MLSELSDIEFPNYFTQLLCGCCCKPVVTPKLVVDVLKWPYKHQMSSNDLKISKKVINHRDQKFFWPCCFHQRHFNWSRK